MDSLLTIDNLSLAYRMKGGASVAVLRGAELSVARGESVGIMGDSGSGKTTLLRYILGISSGNAVARCASLQFEGQNLLEMSARQRNTLRHRRLGIIFQDPAHRLSPFRRIDRQIMDAGARGAPRTDAVAALREVGIAQPIRLASSYPHQLSGGECQRVAIAQALAPAPSLLLADEPTSALDTTAQRQILDLLLTIRAQRNIAMLVISHDPSLLSALTDRILRLHDGMISAFVPSFQKSALHRPNESKRNRGEKPVLEVENIRVTFGVDRSWKKWFARPSSHPVLRGVSLQVGRGECLAVVGASGAGKSTLAACIAGIVSPDAGSIVFEGNALSSRRALSLRARLQLIPQDTAGSLNPRLKIARIVQEPFDIQLHRREERARPDVMGFSLRSRIDTALKGASLSPDYLNRYPSQISGGERQRVAIARALIVNPSLLLLDEALTGLDYELQHKFLRVINELRETLYLTCVHFSHQLSLMLEVADRIAVMEEGRVVECLPAPMFIEQARHPASLRLLNSMLLDVEDR